MRLNRALTGGKDRRSLENSLAAASGGLVPSEPSFPVFVLGDARSGTTLVYSMLLATGRFPRYEEGETHLLECRARYGSLRREPNWRRFLEDWLRSLQFRRSGLDADTFRREAEGHRASYTAFLAYFMGAMCRREGKARWAEKTPAHALYLDELAGAFPDARFVHVIRDGRDVAVSKRKLGWSGTRSRDPVRQLIYAVKAWERLVRLVRGRGARLGERYLELRYEDVVTDPASATERLGAFAGVSISPAALAASDVGALGSGYTAFGGQMHGVSRAGLYRWKTELSPVERGAVDAAAGRTLALLGYETRSERPGAALAHRAYAALCPLVQVTARALRTRTPLGRLMPVDLEMS